MKSYQFAFKFMALCLFNFVLWNQLLEKLRFYISFGNVHFFVGTVEVFFLKDYYLSSEKVFVDIVTSSSSVTFGDT